MTCPEASRTTWGRPSVSRPPAWTATKRAIRGFADVNAIADGTTVVHVSRKNRHWWTIGPETVLGLAGRSGSFSSGDIRKRRGLMASAKSNSEAPSRAGPARPLVDRETLQERLGHDVDERDPGGRLEAADGDVDHQQRGIRLAGAFLVFGAVREPLGKGVAERRGLEQRERGDGAGRLDDVARQHAAEVAVGGVVDAGGGHVRRRVARERRDLLLGVLRGLRVLTVVEGCAADHDRGEAGQARLLHRRPEPLGLRSVGPTGKPARGVVDSDDPDGARRLP